jgi:hypothetical protein
MMGLKELATRYSTWVVTLAMGVVAWWIELPVAEQAKFIADYPLVAKLAPWSALAAFLIARAAPQGTKQ